MKAPSSLAKLEKMRRLKNKNWRKLLMFTPVFVFKPTHFLQFG